MDAASNTQKYYDQYWSEGGFQPPSNRTAFIDAQIERVCRSGMQIADLGCGDARTIGDRAAATDASYLGVDVSPSAVKAATERGLDVRLIDDIASTGLPDQKFDVVFIIEVLEHLLEPTAAVAEAFRILKPGGELLVTVPNSAVWPRRVELAFRGRSNAMGDDRSRSEPWRDPHIRFFTVPTLEAMLRTLPFTSVTVGGTEPMSPIAPERLARLNPALFCRRCTAVARK